MRIIISEDQYNRIFVDETAKIRPFTDADYDEVNPSQRTDVDFAKIKRSDDKYNEKHNLNKKESRNSTEQYRELDGYGKKLVDKLQDKITRKIQDRFMKQTGKKKPVIPKKELGTVRDNEVVRNALKNGMEVGVKGKTFSFGNTKLPEDIMIVNLTSAWNCPSQKLNECPFGNICYARVGESKFGNTQLRNLRNQFAYKYMSTKDILELVEAYIEQAPVRIKNIRISEDGDFPDQNTLEFCDKLAGHLNKKYGLKTVAYTHRQLDYGNIKNIIINASDYRISNPTRYFICTSPEEWSKLPEGLSFNPDLKIEGVDTSRPVFKCNCDCRQCGFCYNSKGENGEPNDPITVVEALRGRKSQIKTALKNQSKTNALEIPACVAEFN